MPLELRAQCRMCKQVISSIDPIDPFEKHIQGLGWVKEVGYTLDTWLCTECAKKRVNQEQTYSAGASYAVVTTYCDTCRAVHTGIDTGYKTAGYDLTKDGWFEVNPVIHQWRCPACWRIALDEARKKIEQATIKAKTQASAEKKAEMRYPMCLVFKSGKEEIYYVTNKTREKVTAALVSNMAIQFEYFLLTTEEEPSGRFACPHGMIERMQ